MSESSENQDINTKAVTDAEQFELEDEELTSPKTMLYDADSNCKHDIQPQWSGIKCTKCSGWFCY